MQTEFTCGVAKIITDMCKRGGGYNITFTVLRGDMQGKIKIEASPIHTGLGTHITIDGNADILDALKAIEFTLH